MTPSIIADIRDILEQKGLDDHYINQKMHGFEGVKTNFEALALARFLDSEGRSMLAQKTGFTKHELNGFSKWRRALFRDYRT
ncbi:hypothetical protein PS1M3_20470 [Pseudoalteromonas sp. PS1M3]|uniref:hypothetical protein n=1 Tax=Pseudoalteromonas sp. PS1M3 TaxID=87791 RepID=UPI00194F2F22|nr:hypothetical protein [Pseudoalteromonas sp. PS1M3]BBW91960.1 hypothetical protein PS1M3_20470 [Pseudoalteromonas sp. PS1M3]